jgi:hypothetical protein
VREHLHAGGRQPLCRERHVLHRRFRRAGQDVRQLRPVRGGFGGPTGVKDLTYFLSFRGTFDDGYLKTSASRPRQTIPTSSRSARARTTTTSIRAAGPKPGPNYKLTFEYLNNKSNSDIYSHEFSLNGFVQTRIDTSRTTGQIQTRYGRFSAEALDSTYVPYNAAEHTPVSNRKFDQVKLVWNHTLSQQTFYTIKMSRHMFDLDYRIQGKNPWDYTTIYPNQWQDRINGQTIRFFATNGDYPDFTQRRTVTWTFKTDWIREVGRHRFKRARDSLQRLQLLSVQYPLQVSADGKLGGFRSQYLLQSGRLLLPAGPVGARRHGHQRRGASTSSRSAASSMCRNRQPVTQSVRRGSASPTRSPTATSSFHYGRFSQIPDRQYIFENRGAATQVRCNPNLENETTVSYQAALQHMFSQDVFGQFSVYFKDIFGLLTIDQLSAGDNPQLVNSYVNKDYASARGFEVTLQKRFSHNFSGELSYGYGIASGVASDPNQQRNTQLLYLPISEQPLDWDQRHTFSAQMLVSQPEDWLANIVWSFGSGFPYTPTPRNQRKVDPSKTNGGRLPSITNLNVQAEKHYRVWGQDVKLFFRGNNVLDATNISDLEPSNWPAPPGTNNDDYRVFYTETGRAGGAYQGDDLNGDGIADWVAVNDPRVFQEGRNLRVGLGVKF